MISALLTALCVVYLAAALLLALYAVSQAHLLLRSIRPEPARPPPLTGTDLPQVTVQLPIRNERCVVRELLACIAQLDWPRDRLHIQLLDDSDDETVAIAARACRDLSARGWSVDHVRRPDPVGFKAGALAHGLSTARGHYLALFDADFRPHPDFLRRAVAVLEADTGLGLAQGRWGHLNRDHSVVTRAQAFHLDAHFGVEQRARSGPPLLMGFNGTAGVWRRAAIDDAGGWSADSLTEDLDLAYRAQLVGWRLTYVDDLDAPAELPDDVRAVRSQQRRWMKGGAQVCRKLLRPLWASDRPLLAKLQGTIHLGSGALFLVVSLLLALTPLLQPARAVAPGVDALLAPASVLLQLTLAVIVMLYATSCVRRDGYRSGLRRLARDLVPFLALSTGLALHNAVAVLDGWSGRSSPFVRTPKRGTDHQARPYAPVPAGRLALAELALALWGAGGLVVALANRQWVLGGFLALQAAGCGFVALGGLGLPAFARALPARR